MSDSGVLKPPPQQSFLEKGISIFAWLSVAIAVVIFIANHSTLPSVNINEQSATIESKSKPFLDWLALFFLVVAIGLFIWSALNKHNYNQKYLQWQYSLPPEERQALIAKEGQQAIGNGIGRIGSGIFWGAASTTLPRFGR